MHFSDDTVDNMVVRNANINNIMKGMESTGGVRLHNHRRKLKQRFDIIRKLGQGTYGKVQLGINKETGQEVAIKTIKKAKIETEADLIRIRREIQIMSSVQHPNIIHIYEVFENREKMVLVMEYAAGGELYDYLNERKVLSEDEARRIFRQIATAVYYCHKHKICHRDLKLENILLDEQGSAKIADFGLSNVFDEQRLLNTFCGSPLYASPEIVKGTPYYGPEVDCWSLGVLLYTLVYGAMPFDGSNFKRLVKQISQGDYFEPKKTSPASSLIREMLAVSPAKRANIENVCSHWWVNEGYSESCLEIAEELAGLTPVRLDLLLSLAPNPPGVSTENIMQQGLNTMPTIPHSDVPVRCHSMGSLMDVSPSPNAQQTFLRKQSLSRNSGPASAQSRGATSGSSAKRKLDEGASFSETNLKSCGKDVQAERGYGEMDSNDETKAEKAQIFGEVKINEPKHLKPDLEDKEMNMIGINNPMLEGASNIPSLTESNLPSKDPDVSGQEKSSSKDSTMSGQSSSATITAADSLLGDLSFSNEQSMNDIDLTNNKDGNLLTKENSQVSDQIKRESETTIAKDGIQKTLNINKDSILQENIPLVPKELHKVVERRKDKQKKTGNFESSPDTGKEAQPSLIIDNISSSGKSEFKITGSTSSTNSGVLSEDDTEVSRSNMEVLKEKNDGLRKSQVSNSKPAESLKNAKERKPNAAQSAENLNVSLNSETKNGTKSKPKRIYIPGVKVSDFKKAFERKLSSPEISVTSFGKKLPSKSGPAGTDKPDDTFNVNKSNESQKSASPNESKQMTDNSDNTISIHTVKPKMNNECERGSANISKNHSTSVIQKNITSGSNSPSAFEVANELNARDDTKMEDSRVDKLVDVPIDNIRRENVPNTDKVKSTISSKQSNKIQSDSQPEGKDGKNTTQSSTCQKDLRSSASRSIIINDTNETSEKALLENKPQDSTSAVTPQAKPIENTGNKKRSKVEITLKSATLPRRKTSKAEIKLDTTIPPLEFKTEIEHMVNPPLPTPSTPEKHSGEDKYAVGSAQSLRSWSLEPEGAPHRQVSAHECIIPIQLESSSIENPNLSSTTCGRPPAYPFQQRSLSQIHRSRNLSHQSTQESDSGELEKIKKSPREYIIPIAVEGGGYVTPRSSSMEPTTREDFKHNTPSSRTNNYRRMSSILSDTSEDEGLNMPPMGLQRLGSLSRDRDEGRNFHFHRLRSSRPIRNSLERNDSLSSAEEDDDDDEGFEILTAESLFSTLLSRVRSLTQRLTVEDAKVSGIPPNHFVNQLTNIGSPSRPWRKFYDFHREPLSRRLSETSFPRFGNYDGDRDLQNERSLSRDSSRNTDMNSESSCSIRTLPRGSSNHECNQCEVVRRGTMRSFSPQQSVNTARGGVWQEEPVDKLCPCSELSLNKSSTKKSTSQTASHGSQSNTFYTPRKLFRTRSLRSTLEDKRLYNSQSEKNYSNQYLPNVACRQRGQVGASAISNNSFSRTWSSQRNEIKNPTSLRSAVFTPNMSSENVPLVSASGNSLTLSGSNSTIPIQKLDYRLQRESSYAPYLQSKHSSLPRSAGGAKSIIQKCDDGKSPLSPSKLLNRKAYKDKNDKYEHLERSKSHETGNVSPFCVENNAQTRLNDNKSSTSLCSQEESVNIPGATRGNNFKIPSSTSSQNVSTSRVKSDAQFGARKKSAHHSNNKANNTASVSDTTGTGDVISVQERRKSRFLRPDFFDTPPEESSYVKEREDKKAAEAELKQARRVSRRTLLKAMSARGIQTQDDKNVQRNTQQVNKNNNENVDSKTMDTYANSTNVDERKGIEGISHSKDPCVHESRSFSSDNNNKYKKSCTSNKRKDSKGTSGILPFSVSRVERNVHSLPEPDSSPWDMKTIASESTYLKRAVSVDDVSYLDRSLPKNNCKVGGKISSVLRLFSKPDPQNTYSQHNSSKYLRNTDENLNQASKNSNSGNQLDTCKNFNVSCLEEGNNNSLRKIKQSQSAHVISSENMYGTKNVKYKKPSKYSAVNRENKGDSKTSNKNFPGASLDLSSDSGGKDSLLNNPIREPTIANVKNNRFPGCKKSTEEGTYNITKKKTVLEPGDSLNLPSGSSDILNSTSSPEDSVSRDLEQVQENNNQTSDTVCLSENADECVNNTELNSSENDGLACASSSSNALDNLSLTDDNEKDSESVEDRIRRKSFYTRFNDVKKKVRKKSPQFIKENRTTTPSNQKNLENQSFPLQNTRGDEGEKSSDVTHPEKNQFIPAENTVNTTYEDEALFENLPVSKMTNMNVDEAAGRDPSFNTSEDTTNSCSLLRPAVFIRNIVDNSATSSKRKSSNKTEIKGKSNSDDHSQKEVHH